ncbi:MAG: fumarylacetoacetate hydrolase family protein [Gammaproteobacteria bacterium]|nr:fumarylacetoacetate hydrolase family protein [Gammaproteobacteria bacterium]
MSTARIETLAAGLAAARENGTTIAPPDEQPTLREAYAIQDAASARLDARSSGWKVGSTSEQAQRRLGTNEPGAGRLPQRFTHASGAVVPIARAHGVCVEVEFAFRMGRDLEPRARPYTTGEVRAAIDALVPAMELVGSRFDTGLSCSGRCLVTADGGANVALITGTDLALDPSMDLRACVCRLFHNDRMVAEGAGERALGDPMNVLMWLVEHLSGRGLGLARGAIVSTGTCTGLVPVSAGDRLLAVFDGLGQVEAVLSDQTATSATGTS